MVWNGPSGPPYFDIQYQNIMNLKVVDYGKVINTFANKTKKFSFFSKVIFPKSSKMVIKSQPT